MITRGYRLPARFVIHAVGPVWRGGNAREAELLASAYETSFSVARDEGSIRTIAFPAISTGVYGFPKAPAAEIDSHQLAPEAELERITGVLTRRGSVYRDVRRGCKR